MACQHCGISLKCSMYLSRGCHPALPSFIIQQKVLVGFKDESQNQCRKCTTVVEKWGAENMLLSECYKHDLYKRESAKGIQKRCLSLPEKPRIWARWKSQWQQEYKFSKWHHFWGIFRTRSLTWTVQWVILLLENAPYWNLPNNCKLFLYSCFEFYTIVNFDFWFQISK